MRVQPPRGWEPISWRDVPPAPFEVITGNDLIDQLIAEHNELGLSLADCRSFVKNVNQNYLRQRRRDRWLIVVATDGRLAKNATPATKGGVA